MATRARSVSKAPLLGRGRSNDLACPHIPVIALCYHLHALKMATLAVLSPSRPISVGAEALFALLVPSGLVFHTCQIGIYRQDYADGTDLVLQMPAMLHSYSFIQYSMLGKYG